MVNCVRQHWNRSSLILAVSVLLIGAVLSFYGQWLGRLIRFQLLKPHYERVLTRLRERAGGGTVRLGELDTREYIVEPGPPLRVAFIWPGGFLDNWCGVVYDPLGEVMKANLFKEDWSNWNALELQRVKILLGGDIYRCEHLYGDWYFCWFT